MTKTFREKLVVMMEEYYGMLVDDEWVDKEKIAERFGITQRTAERLIERCAGFLRKNCQSWDGYKLYLWSDVLACAQVHVEVEEEKVARARRVQQRVRILEAVIKRFQADNARLVDRLVKQCPSSRK